MFADTFVKQLVWKKLSKNPNKIILTFFIHCMVQYCEHLSMDTIEPQEFFLYRTRYDRLRSLKELHRTEGEFNAVSVAYLIDVIHYIEVHPLQMMLPNWSYFSLLLIGCLVSSRFLFNLFTKQSGENHLLWWSVHRLAERHIGGDGLAVRLYQST